MCLPEIGHCVDPEDVASAASAAYSTDDLKGEEIPEGLEEDEANETDPLINKAQTEDACPTIVSNTHTYAEGVPLFFYCFSY